MPHTPESKIKRRLTTIKNREVRSVVEHKLEKAGLVYNGRTLRYKHVSGIFGFLYSSNGTREFRILIRGFKSIIIRHVDDDRYEICDTFTDLDGLADAIIKILERDILPMIVDSMCA